MQPTYGLYSHIQANRTRSVFLLASFVVLLAMLQFSLFLLWTAFTEFGLPLNVIARDAWNEFLRGWPVAMMVAAIWFAIAYFYHHSMIRFATGAHAVSRKEAPELYNALENLCVSRGIPMPRLEIIESDALNAYAAGLKEGDYTIAVTRGLLKTLSPEELEAVLGHELTHIRNKDTQMMVVAIIFAGIFAFAGDLIFRGWDFPYSVYPRSRSSTRDDNDGVWSGSNSAGDGESKGSGGGAAGALIAIAIAVVIILITWGVSTLIRFALSRSREFLADAGAVELTKNPDAMIGALQKISKNPRLEVMSRMEAFFIETPVTERITGLLSTHPSIDERIEALKTYAGGWDNSGPAVPSEPSGPWSSRSAT